MVVTLVQLEVLVHVAALGTFSRAAERLEVTQPAVTQQIRALERGLGVRLVDVVGRRPMLTEVGRLVAARATTMLDSVAMLEREIAEVSGLRSGVLSLGATLTIGTFALPGMLARFSTAHPDVRMHVEIANTEAIAARVRGGALGLALVEGPLDDPALEIVPYQDDRLVLVVSPGHRLARSGRHTVEPGELDGEALVWRESGSGTRLLAEQQLAAAGVRTRAVLELPSGEGVARAVEAGLGSAILSPLVVERAVVERRLVAIEIVGLALHRTFRLVSLRSQTPGPAAAAFSALARQGYG